MTDNYQDLIAQYQDALRRPVRAPSDQELAGLELRHVETRRFRNKAKLDGDPDLRDINRLYRLQRMLLVRIRHAHAKRKRQEARHARKN